MFVLVRLLSATVVGLGLWCWASPASAAQQWVPPVAGPLIVERPLDLPADLIDRPWQGAHRGVDLAVAVGDAVEAVGGGVVVFAGSLAGRGVISVEHAGGLRTTYEPVDAVVTRGERVGAGERIGAVAAGGTHCASTCLHWALKSGDQYLDPLALLRSPSVELLPHLRHTRELGLAGSNEPSDSPNADANSGSPSPRRSDLLDGNSSEVVAGRSAAVAAQMEAAPAEPEPSRDVTGIAVPLVASTAAATAAAWRVHRSHVGPR